MNISRDIVMDLLPLYMAGEVSKASREAVEELLSQDAQLKARVEAARGIRFEEAPAPRQHGEKLALERTQRLLSWKSWLTGLSIFFTMLPMSFVIQNGKVTFQLARDLPLVAVASLGLGMAGWVAYAMTCRRLEATGLERPRGWWSRLVWAGVGFGYGNMAAAAAKSVLPGTPRLATSIFTALAALAVGEWLHRRNG